MSKEFEKIDRYLSGQMDTTERLAFEQRMSEEAILAAEVKLERQSRNVVQIAGRQHLKARLEKFDQPPQNKKKSIRLPGRWWILAASVLLLVVAGLLWSQQRSSYNKAPLFAEHFESYRSPAQVRGTETITDDWTKAIDFYEQEAFEEAIPLFQSSLQSSDQPSYLVQFYLGICYLAKKDVQATAAIQAFDQVLLSNTPYQQQTRWYKALACLYLDQEEEARILLEDIVRQQDFRSKEATEILEKL